MVRLSIPFAGLLALASSRRVAVEELTKAELPDEQSELRSEAQTRPHLANQGVDGEVSPRIRPNVSLDRRIAERSPDSAHSFLNMSGGVGYEAEILPGNGVNAGELFYNKLPKQLRKDLVMIVGGKEDPERGEETARLICAGFADQYDKESKTWFGSKLEAEWRARHVGWLRRIVDYVLMNPACHEYPDWMWAYGWRLHQMQLAQCLVANLSQGDRPCRMRCAFDRDAWATLSCNSTTGKLEGEPPEGQCRIRHGPPRSEDGGLTSSVKKIEKQTEAGSFSGFQIPMLIESSQPMAKIKEPKGQKKAGVEGRLAHLEKTFSQIPMIEDSRVNWVQAFWGIPFGARVERFKRPRKVDPWTGTKHSTDYYATGTVPVHCAPDKPSDASDDCLVLSVYVPPARESSTGKLPVVIFLRGSGFRSGDAWDYGFYDMSRHAYDANAIYVVPNARSGLFGFWASKTLKEEDEDGSTGNYGLLDQRLAMEWVRDNIESFGGDPERVTLEGYSSGAISTAFHLYSPKSEGLFDRAVVLSGPVEGSWFFQDWEEAADMYSTIAEAVGCPKEDSQEQIDCLRRLPSSTLTDFSNKQTKYMIGRIKKEFKMLNFGMSVLGEFINARFGGSGKVPEMTATPDEDTIIKAPPTWPVIPIGPCVDGSDSGLPKPPSQLPAHNVPTMISYTKDEGTFFALLMLFSFPWLNGDGTAVAAAKPKINHASVNGIIDAMLGKNELVKKQLLTLYPKKWRVSPFMRMSTLIQDMMFTCPAYHFADRRTHNIQRIASEAPQHAKKVRQPVYVARTDFNQIDKKNFFLALFNPEKKTPYAMNKILGTHHMSAVGHVMGQGYSKMYMNEDGKKFSVKFRCHLAMFAHTGNPNRKQFTTSRNGTIEVEIPFSQRPLSEQPDVCKHHTTQFKGQDDHWVPYAEYHGVYRLNRKSKLDRMTAKQEDRCRFWKSVTRSDTPFVDNLCRNCSQVTKELQISLHSGR